MRRICCIGAGYVGGPTMAVIAYKCPHITVTVVDINEERIKAWNNENLNLLPVYEPGLDEIISKCRGINLFFSSEVNLELSRSDIIFLSVNTPTKSKGIGAGKASDLIWVEKSARQIAKYAKNKSTIVEKSTIPVKTAETIKEILETSNQTNNEKKDFNVLSNPEFLAEGTAIENLINPDRILIGGDNEEAINLLADIYLNWIPKEKILRTNIWSSELSKLTANAFLAQRISSINSISALCEKTGAEISEVSRAIGMDSRIGQEFLNSGPGFGGSCFKKDILSLVYICNYYGLNKVADFWEQVILMNDWQQKRITETIIMKLFGTISNKTISIFGFAFKKNTNDTRESPSIKICKELLNEGANLLIYDPKVSPSQITKELDQQENKSNIFHEDMGVWKFCNKKEDACKNSDAIVILTEWEEFKLIKWDIIKRLMRSPSWLFDTRNIIDKKEALSKGFKIWSVGSKNQ